MNEPTSRPTGRPTGRPGGRPTHGPAGGRAPKPPVRRTVAAPAPRPRTGPSTGWSGWTDRAAWAPRLESAALRGTGTALALAAAGTGEGTLTARFGPIGVAAVAVGALWAAVPAPEGAAAHPVTWPARLTATRTTLLPTAAVLFAALGEPPLWRALAVTVLLIGYLLLLDTLGPRRRTVRPFAAVAAAGAALLVLPVAFAPTAAGEWSRPLALLGLAAAACGVAAALRPDRTPDQDPDTPTGP
ncbi:hypothetical protein [Kitasatospora sp. NPDC048538]|uniref:hypothetical protein n=1 Tax=unclassified Kitasatospora TaxID=2633591 RepID=UPI0033DA95AC